MLKKFLDNGLKLDFGGGMFDSIKKGMESLTELFDNANIDQSRCVVEDCEAIGILAISLLILSLIDSAALLPALTAMAVSFGELIGALAILSQIGGGVRGISLAAISTALVALATAVLILSVAVKILSTMSWEELAKGLLTTVMLRLLVGVADSLEGSTASLISAGIAMIAIAIGLTILAVAMKIFATMSWGEMPKAWLALLEHC